MSKTSHCRDAIGIEKHINALIVNWIGALRRNWINRCPWHYQRSKNAFILRQISAINLRISHLKGFFDISSPPNFASLRLRNTSIMPQHLEEEEKTQIVFHSSSTTHSYISTCCRSTSTHSLIHRKVSRDWDNKQYSRRTASDVCVSKDIVWNHMCDSGDCERRTHSACWMNGALFRPENFADWLQDSVGFCSSVLSIWTCKFPSNSHDTM